MQLMVAVCYPDGESPESPDQFFSYEEEDAAEEFAARWGGRSTIYIFCDHGVIECAFICAEECEAGESHKITGKFLLVTLQEIGFQETPDKARFH